MSRNRARSAAKVATLTNSDAESGLLILLRHKFLTARAFGDRRGAAWAS